MVKLLFLALGGALGTLSRYELDGLISHHQSRHLPWSAVFPLGTLIVNLTGCFLIGFLAAISGPSMGRAWLKPETRDFLMLGFCGGYTTFSSYGLQTLNLARDGEWIAVLFNVTGSNLLGLAGVYLGRICGLWLQSRFHGGSL